MFATNTTDKGLMFFTYEGHLQMDHRWETVSCTADSTRRQMWVSPPIP